MAESAAPESGVLEATRHRGRLDFLDALRGIAAVLVVVEHAAQAYRWKPGVHFTSHVVQLGQLGVMVFFFVSGFIIPVSLERHGNLKSFWVARVFRLYPLYWFSLIAIYVLWQNGFQTIDQGVRAHPVEAFLANFTMAARVFHQPYAIGIYWTLLFELAFYLACSLLFVLGWLRYSDRIALVLMVLVLLKTYGPMVIGHPARPSALPFVAMFTGTVLYRVYAGTLAPRRAAPVVAGAALMAILANAPFIGRAHQPKYVGGDSFTPMAVAFLGALAIVLFAMSQRHRSVPRWLRHLGLVSYSIYIVHPLLLGWIKRFGPTGLFVLIFVAIVIAVSTVTYRVIEAPAIHAGRKVVHRLERRRVEDEPDPAPV